MVSVFYKAGIIVILVFIANFFAVRSLEDGRQGEIAGKLEQMERDSQNMRLIILYTQLEGANKTDICPALELQTKEQIERANGLAYQMERYAAANLLTSLKDAKERYMLQSLELWLYLKQLESVCGKQEISPILYFYPEKAACPECNAQAEFLNSFRDRCRNVRVFAFPYNRDLGLIQILTTKYKVTRAPTLVINESTYEGVIDGDKLGELIKCAA
ncbi:MAG TPA: hypothetical protein VJI13_00020 [Candidatus Norongarragalinales archaeon]|nr:hypothetical protein [Candidatus Norongarragalinales archaeon]